MIARSVSEPRTCGDREREQRSPSTVSRISTGTIMVSVAGEPRRRGCATTDSLVAQLLPKSNVTTCLTKIQQLLPDRLVEAELAADAVDLRRVRDLAGELLGRIAADRVEQEEHQQDDAEQRRDDLPDAANEIGEHGGRVGVDGGADDYARARRASTAIRYAVDDPGRAIATIAAASRRRDDAPVPAAARGPPCVASSSSCSSPHARPRRRVARAEAPPRRTRARRAALRVPDRRDRLRSGAAVGPVLELRHLRHLRDAADVRLPRAAGEARPEHGRVDAGDLAGRPDVDAADQEGHLLHRRPGVRRQAARADRRGLRLQHQARLRPEV